MILYLDTSALVKIYVEERGSANVRAQSDHAEGVATSRIAYAEAKAAFARKRRERGLSHKGYRSVIGDLDRDWDDYFVVDVSDGVVKSAGILAERHALRGADAIHLASALALASPSEPPVVFFCFDSRLSSAARKEHLGVGS